jgi:hypothetical protein
MQIKNGTCYNSRYIEQKTRLSIVEVKHTTRTR